MDSTSSQTGITTVTADIAGRPLTLEVGRVAGQATSAIMARYGDTVVLVTIVMGKDRADLGYFPLSVDYVERLYSAGLIKGSRWVKREGRPSDEGILIGRLIDRSIRPLFPSQFTNEVQIMVHELSVDGDNDPGILGLIATSAALRISPIPWNGPLGGTKVGQVDGAFVVNPMSQQRDASDLELLVTSSRDLVDMIEAGAKEIPDDRFVEAVNFAHQHNQKVIDLIEELAAKIKPTKIQVAAVELAADVLATASTFIKAQLQQLKSENRSIDYNTVYQAFKVAHEGEDMKPLDAAFSKAWKKAIREIITSGTRTDGRKIEEIRPIGAEVAILPRTHGSALFSRGSTQVLTVATLGTPSLSQLIETSAGEETKRYIHHYSMPPYASGEAGRIGSPSRREIGHGALAEKALEPVIPNEQEFPYTIRLVSEILSSNGSTSQGSVSGSTLALMDAGVPILRPVAGVAMGLISDAPQGPIILSDIAGIEDFNGDMDFKVAGTDRGITAVQLDVKIPGLKLDWVKEIIARARKDRLFILDKMTQAISAPRPQLSIYAPKVVIIKIDTDKIGEVIGPGGKMIRRIIAETGASVDVEDDGSVTIAAVNQTSVDKAVEWIKGLTTDPQVGTVYTGTVKRLTNFGAFVEILPGKEGLVHVSDMSTEFVNDPSEIVSEGDSVTVKLKEIDELKRLNLTMLLDDTRPAAPRRPSGPPRGGRGGYSGGDRGGRRPSGNRGGYR